MKEVIALIRRYRAPETKAALDRAGFPGVTSHSVHGRGKQGGRAGLIGEIDPQLAELMKPEEAAARAEFVPKAMLTLIVRAEDVSKVVDIILRTNRSGYTGDGRIFVCPVDKVIRIRTGESGATAIV